MADAKKCDRCGRYYDKNDRYANPHQFDDSRTCAAGPIEVEYMAKISIATKWRKIIAEYDLCDDCIRDLKYFMSNPPTIKKEA